MKSKFNSYLLMAFTAVLFVLSSCRKENKTDYAPEAGGSIIKKYGSSPAGNCNNF